MRSKHAGRESRPFMNGDFDRNFVWARRATPWRPLLDEAFRVGESISLGLATRKAPADFVSDERNVSSRLEKLGQGGVRIIHDEGEKGKDDAAVPTAGISRKHQRCEGSYRHE